MKSNNRILLALALASIMSVASAADRRPAPARGCSPTIDCGVPGHGQNPHPHPKPKPPKEDKPQCWLPEGCKHPRGPRP